MPVIRIKLEVEVDGQPLGGYPLTRRIETAEMAPFDYAKVVDAGTHATLPITSLAAVQALLVRPSAEMTVRLDGQSDAGIVLAADGLLLILDGTIDAGASTNATISNVSGATAQVRGLAAGS